MKLAAKVFNWITIIISILLIIFIIILSIVLGLSVERNGNNLASVFVIISFATFIIPLLVPLVICIVSNHQINKAKSRNDIKTMGILTLIFGNFISGIIMLCLEDKDFANE